MKLNYRFLVFIILIFIIIYFTINNNIINHNINDNKIIENLDNCDNVCVNSNKVDTITKQVNTISNNINQLYSNIEDEKNRNIELTYRTNFVNNEFIRRKKIAEKKENEANNMKSKTNNISFE